VCGLAGILTLDGAPPDAPTLARMGAALRHRGPDAQGVYIDGSAAPGVGLVHRRLSIIDLSHRADQPIAGEDGRVRVMLNGEIYNFPELKAPLESRHAFRSQGDTEVIAHLYEERGEEAIALLDGMFALALWDADRRRLLLARDPFGKKPLYYFRDARRFVFGSEIKALLAAGVPAAFDADNLHEYLAFGYVPTPRTLFQGIRRLPPASLLAVDAAASDEPRAYWRLRVPPAGAESRQTAGEARERVRELLTAAVRKRLLSDVPLGALLSGGLDSSLVTAIMARLSPARVKTFTVGFEGDAYYDERAHAERVARHLATEHHASLVKPEAASLLPTLLHHHDEPFGDSSALPTYLVAREARRHVTVVVNGDGGDEAFAGYDRFQAALLAERIPLALRRALRAAAGGLPEGPTYHGPLRRIRRFTRAAPLPVAERLLAWTGSFDLPALARLDASRAVDGPRVLSSYDRTLAECNGASPLSRLLYLNLRTYLLDDLLPKADRMTMAHGLEGRSPLLDRALLEYAATLPDAFKRRGGRGKIVLREVAAELLPREILERPKHGFGVPLGDWFRGELRPMVQDTLLSTPRLGRRLRVEAVREIFEEHVSGRADRGHQLWTLLTLELWLRKHGFD
jgi:asparagine synthase (glutamine-hydrolysing)